MRTPSASDPRINRALDAVDGKTKYEPTAERTVDFAGVRNDGIVLMGEEVVRPIDDGHFGRVMV